MLSKQAEEKINKVVKNMQEDHDYALYESLEIQRSDWENHASSSRSNASIKTSIYIYTRAMQKVTIDYNGYLFFIRF
jgi:hypothetical protein